MAATKGTAIGRRLAVRRPAHGPPWRGRQAAHGSIVAPLAATLAATVAATLALSVGVALARAERERRSISSRRARARRFAPLPGERVEVGLRRMALGQLDLAIELLANERLPVEKAVHDTRKALKRLRTLIRLLADQLGESAFAHEDAVLRDAGLRLAKARDAEVMVITLDDLVARHHRKLARRRDVSKLRRALVAERDSTVQLVLGERAARAQVLADLRAARERVAAWRLPAREGIEAVEPGLERVYRQGRVRHRRAARAQGGRARAMHRWRKRVKDLRYAAEMLDFRPDDNAQTQLRELGARKRGRRSRGRSAAKGAPRFTRRVAVRADELGELLGEEHDLVLLAARVRSQGKWRSRRTRRTLLKLIARRRKRLRGRALRDGRRLYRHSPKRFVARVRATHAHAQGHSGV